MTDNEGLMRELRERLDADEKRRGEMLEELRELQAGTDRGGHEAMNDAIRGVRGSPMPDGPKTMNEAIRGAAGRPPRKENP